MLIYHVIRPTDSVKVAIMFNRTDNKYHFVNMTHDHICPCSFDTIEDAIHDMEQLKQQGKIIYYIREEG